MPSTPRSRAIAFLCAMVLPVCGLIIRPHVELGINDDWSYIRTAQIFAQTGHLVYNGQGAPYQGWQTVFAALFIRLLGFSFSVTRDSVLVLSMLAAFLAHRIFVRCGISDKLAVIGTLSLFLSPLCLPLVFSFMTDVPGLLVIELCLYACLRALQSRSDKTALLWIILAAASSVLGGTSRQTGWLGVALMVPATVLLLRHSGRRLLTAGTIVYLISIALVFLLNHWFSHQPLIIPPTPLHHMEPWNVLALRRQLTQLALELPTLLLPLLCIFPIALLRPDWLRRHRVLASALLILIAADLYLRHTQGNAWLAPYLPNNVTPNGLLDGTPILGNRPVLLHRGLRILATVLTDTCLAALLLHLFTQRPAPSQTIARLTITTRQLWALLAPLTAVYLILLLPSAAFIPLFDRYALLLLFVATIPLLRIIDRSLPTLPALALFAPLTLFALISVAATHDALAMVRARLAAIHELEAANIPPTSIDGGLEYNAWTQVLRTGRVNQLTLMSPAEAAKYATYYTEPHPCTPLSGFLFPDLHAQFALSYNPDICGGPTAFPPAVYRQWLGQHEVPIYIIRLQQPTAP